ncbi:2-oxo-4-hydroxy-4-carboxy-5-ureidoimidazoline decarboxylase [Paenibacillus spiritus]|uniref:2-oxo-4-hydroxy-4-carboxy-5-ureidoimidazoline decarboxylase n=1 Tax=Paenibacillus spiritus TaxID=2496557 RepID=A0A5J5GC08_9BACL|nr:2-oxo-4-hydroxy-4-carboxy-5-ureidoimidazoline decarboxylase [Paenibacillus spiritus]
MKAQTLMLDAVNKMDREAFVSALGGIYEHSPWVAEAAWPERPFADVEDLHEAMEQAVRSAGEERSLALLRSHPDLATRMQVTPLSAAEQRGAGLDRLAPEQFAEMSGLNRRYTEKFGFPFILAVRGRTADEILASLRERLPGERETELARAMQEVGRIAGFRLRDLITEGETEQAENAAPPLSAGQSGGSGRLTTHVLDLSRGTPAPGLVVELRLREEDGGWRLLKTAVTNADGRLEKPLLEGGELAGGSYELLFRAGDYWRRIAGTESEAFLEEIPIRFRVAEPDAHYHVPLLLAPGGYSTYRGS